MKSIFKKITSKAYVISILVLFQLFLVYLFMYSLSNYVPVVYFFVAGAGIVLSVIIINTKMNPSYKLSWIFLILTVPLIGVTTYLMFGGRKVPKDLRTGINQLSLNKQPILLQDKEPMQSLYEVCPRSFKISNYIFKATDFTVNHDSKVTYYPTGETKYKALMEALRGAEKFIFLEYFIVVEGFMLSSIKKILIEKAKAGVEIKIIFDDFGALKLPKSFRAEMKEAGISLYFFNPVRPLLAIYMNNRDHRKIAVIDGKIGFIGGINIADEYINKIKRFGHWKDTAIKIEGNAVFSLTIMFLHFYRHLSKQDIHFLDYKVENPEYLDEGFVQMFSDSPTDEELVSENAHLSLINEAEKYLYIMTPYLVVSHTMMTALTLAAKSGVDVRILVPHIPDKWYVHQVTRSNYEELTKAGVMIYEYTPGFVHGKVMLVDDVMAIVGTSNLDFRSYYMHFECGALITYSKCLMDMKKDFLASLEVSQEITYESALKVHPLVRMGRMLLNVFSSVL
ncbi:MAG: cardiolipin synthase [Erysipelotrichaceae bacterium]|nr:MAG: cardiolipin [Erysipelotrichaceae bacterium]TXT18498.1 MAG: cardiolipin synthase [Erysipelotrichaceae bacterium]